MPLQDSMPLSEWPGLDACYPMQALQDQPKPDRELVKPFRPVRLFLRLNSLIYVTWHANLSHTTLMSKTKARKADRQHIPGMSGSMAESGKLSKA